MSRFSHPELREKLKKDKEFREKHLHPIIFELFRARLEEDAVKEKELERQALKLNFGIY